ncbi:TcaA 3rd/4th domain-containing protein [Liquorilactobacillus capillatus]|uniref:TcaA 4th domain-containing protein n=1 Tax=Liquorilactobacillus capillatus DSM 19910 TaxID=1423731 RepID=A0A0R1ME45_9LACO|nr:hypothetical protein [Liquorilactobacillus capillatus]KRL02587.1 hypothetical protein FC81_GL000624 [Liquorilactobacillus capillatus DSM 19910]
MSFSCIVQRSYFIKTAFQNNISYKGSYAFKRTGNAWLFFPRYKVSIKAAYVKLHIDRTGTEIYQDGKKISETSAHEAVKKVGPLFPGKHTFRAERVIASRKVTSSSTKVVFAGTTKVALKSKTATFTIYGDPRAMVYLNSKKVGTLDSEGQLKFSNYLVSGKLKVYTINSSKKKSPVVSVDQELTEGRHYIYLTTDVDPTIANAGADETDSDSDSEKADKEQVDTKNLTTQQVNDWVFMHIKSNYPFSVTEDDFTFEQKKNDDGLLEIVVRENHASQNMKNHGADPMTTPNIGMFIIDGDGNLQNQTTDEVVATQYGE